MGPLLQLSGAGGPSLICWGLLGTPGCPQGQRAHHRAQGEALGGAQHQNGLLWVKETHLGSPEPQGHCPSLGWWQLRALSSVDSQNGWEDWGGLLRLVSSAFSVGRLSVQSGGGHFAFLLEMREGSSAVGWRMDRPDQVSTRAQLRPRRILFATHCSAQSSQSQGEGDKGFPVPPVPLGAIPTVKKQM